MMDIGFDFSIIWSLFGAIAAIVVLGVCVYYVIVKPGIDSILLVIGSGIQLLTTLFYTLGTRILANVNGADFYSNRWLFTLVGAIAFIGTICFTAGLIVLIINHVKVYKNMQNNSL